MIKIFYDILNKELNKDYLVKHKETLTEYIHNEKFQALSTNYIKDRNFSVFSLFDLFIDYFNDLGPLSRDKWLKSIYYWAVNKSFPNKYKQNVSDDLSTLYTFFMNLFSQVLENFQHLNKIEFLEKYPITLLAEDEESILQENHEYFKFKKIFKKTYIYEIMYLDMIITKHNTLEHVIGVNHVSMHIARQLKELGFPIDLGVVVGASLGHDIGKYGVLEEDSHKVPYFHYYYTEKWFKNFNMDKIGHIATNHSTWDLELEALPLESLILIYSDFRVKNKIENNIYNMHIYSLEESFHIILDKLDNVDETKENRYKKVYKRLKDFEDYMVSLGVDTTLESSMKKIYTKPFELMNGKEIIDNIKYMSIEHNINLMSKLMDNVSFNTILEMARGEHNWRKVRLYLQIFKEYSTHLTQRQKITTLHFLSDLLLHSGEDIRKESSELIGRLIALYDEEYRKELPPSVIFTEPKLSSENLLYNFLNILLFPDYKIADSQREWLYNLKNIVKSLFEESKISEHKKYFDVLDKYYNKQDDLSDVSKFYLSQTINYIPIKSLDEKRLLKLYSYTIKQLDSENIEIRLSTLSIINEMLDERKNIVFIASIRNWLTTNLAKASTPAENYLKYVLGIKINISSNYQEILDKNYYEAENETSDIFLENLKTATEWIKKKINIDILYDQVVKSPSTQGLHTAMHLCNILKVSAIEVVRNYSGKTLLNIFHFLSLEERNDVAIELLRALEMESYQFSKFIPYYLGPLLLYLPPTELDEIIDDFEENIKISSTRVVFLLLNTIAICIENYSFYVERFKQSNEIHDERLDRLMGLLSIAMASYNIDVKNESLRVVSSTLFKSKILTLKDKYILLEKIGKKLLCFLDYNKKDKFLFFNNASSLNHIYKFISDYEFHYGFEDICKIMKVAFFPGSFDPFSISHKEIATEIRNHGFIVYLAVDEFSWSKRTEPHRFRRNIINMSIANERDIFLFPKDIPINISNPLDLKKLKNIFSNEELHIVVGSDVLINASAYKKESPILDFPHIVFDRKSSISKNDDEEILEKSLNNIRASILRLSLPPQYEDISSSKIRKNIDVNRDISKLMDSLAQSYIYDYGLYLREPQYKTLFESKTFEVETLRNIDDESIYKLKKQFANLSNIEYLYSLKNKRNYRILILKDAKTNEYLGFSSFYWIRQNSLYEEFKDSNITEYIRRNLKGRIILISSIYAKNNNEDLIEIILNETLSLCITRDYNVAIFNNQLKNTNNEKIEKQLLLQGFLMTGLHYNNSNLFFVDMNNPCTLNLDLENMIKPPYNQNMKVLNTIRNTRNKLKNVLSNLFPGELLLTYNKDMIYSKLIQKICDANNVSIHQPKVRQLGDNMCVPFGSILNSSIIPNTVTKTMHTEKIFHTNIKDFTVGSYPFYLSLEEQAKVLKSFNRPVILVDDLLHKGYRINVVEPILREVEVNIKKIIVGILSGRGKEIGVRKNIELDSAYFVPNLKLWFNESSQYPYIGGDMVGNSPLKSNSIPSINMILPYVSPSFIKNTENKAIYELSETCLQNSIDIFMSIEELYHKINEKSLTMKNLGEVLIYPRHPDINRTVDLNENIKPSHALKEDLEYLKRLENIIIR